MRVLRNGTPTREVTYPQDELPGTVHLGVYDAAGELVGVASWAIESWPGRPAAAAVRLRGMAVDTTLQGGGYGAALVAAGVEWAEDRGADLVWATARDAVLGFYERCGFHVEGDGFIDEATALPHHTVVREL
ncbi:MAG: GNAT family N-acetyltransferase [Ilumatobacteraceae bacterium]